MKIPRLKSKNLLTVTDLCRDEIFELFELTTKLKKKRRSGKNTRILQNRSLAMIFEKSSTRTRVSFEAGMTQLGGHSLFLSPNDIQLGRGEPFSDTAKVLSRYVDAVMIRTNSHKKIVELAQNADIPVINGLTDEYHPCQALADFFTIYENDRSLKKKRLTYVGDGNNVANSLLLCGAIIGADITIASPKKYAPDINIIEMAYKLSSASGAKIKITSAIDEAIDGTDYLYTDVWVSMGQEKDAAKKKKALSKYKVTMAMLEKCSTGCKVMHCLPAHRGEEIDADVIDSEKSIVFDQAENRLHIQKAILCALMKR